MGRAKDTQQAHAFGPSDGDQHWPTVSWTWTVAWFVVAIGVPAGVWVATRVDLSYAFLIATPGVREILTGLYQHRSTRRILARSIGFATMLWVLGLLVERLLGWGWTDRTYGAIGVAITAMVAYGAVGLRWRFGSGPAS